MFLYEVLSDNKLVDLVKQIKRREMDIYLVTAGSVVPKCPILGGCIPGGYL